MGVQLETWERRYKERRDGSREETSLRCLIQTPSGERRDDLRTKTSMPSASPFQRSVIFSSCVFAFALYIENNASDPSISLGLSGGSHESDEESRWRENAYLHQILEAS